MSEIKLTKEISVPTNVVKVTALNIRRVIDLPERKVVCAVCLQIGRPIVLWSGDAYRDDMGWTRAEAEARLKEVVESGDIEFFNLGGM